MYVTGSSVLSLPLVCTTPSLCAPRNNLFRHVDIDPSNVHILDGNAPDLQRECELYEEKIKEAGGIELFLGGVRHFSVLVDVWDC